MPMQIRRTVTVDAAPTGLVEGQLSVEMASNPPRLWVGVPTSVDASGRVQLVPASNAVSTAALATALADYVPLAGATMTGPLVLAADAAAPLQPTSLQQVETLIQPAHNSGGRNLLHNPFFLINGRVAGGMGWPAFGGFADTFFCDRWRTEQGGGDYWYMQPTTFTIGDGGRAMIGDEMARTGADLEFQGVAAGYTYLQQAIEDVARLSNQTITWSFWAIVQWGGPMQVAASYHQRFGDGSEVDVPGSAITLPQGIWTRCVFTQTLPSSAGRTTIPAFNTWTGMRLWLSCGSGALATLSSNIGMQGGRLGLWGMQVETGSEPTPIERVDPQTDLARCQRYFFGSGRRRAMKAAGAGAYNGWVPFELSYPTTMRAMPTLQLVLREQLPDFPNGTDVAGLSIGPSWTAEGGCMVWGSSAPTGAYALFNFRASADI